MPPLLSVPFTLAIVAVLLWVAFTVVEHFKAPPIVRTLLVAAIIIVAIFFVANLLGVPILGGLRLK